jgi:hypothetical protein
VSLATRKPGQAWHAKAQFESAYLTFDDMAVVVTADPSA